MDAAAHYLEDAVGQIPKLKSLAEEGIGPLTDEPAEIAISILAELIAVRHRRDVSALSMKWDRGAQNCGVER